MIRRITFSKYAANFQSGEGFIWIGLHQGANAASKSGLSIGIRIWLGNDWLFVLAKRKGLDYSDDFENIVNLALDALSVARQSAKFLVEEFQLVCVTHTWRLIHA